jgi:hypothetical protein
MASFLLRNESRFVFLHVFMFCPLKDLVKLHENAELLYSMLVDTDGSKYFENQAIHYLCRPSILEELLAKEFVEEYRVTYWTSKNQNTAMRFLPGMDYVRHPSMLERGKCRENETRGRMPSGKPRAAFGVTMGISGYGLIQG